MRLKTATILLILTIFGCTTSEVAQKSTPDSKDSADSKSVIDPLNFLDKAESFSVNSSEADTIFAPSGSTILFEPNSFVDLKGKPVKGKVDVSWQEFHTLGDIIASGIPMKYDSSGVAYDLESGGMFTIRASQKGNEVKLAPGKEMEVNLASIQDTPCYNFYQLDEKSGKWDYQTTKSGEKPEDSSKDSEEKTAVKTILDMSLNLKDFPELQKNSIVGWKTTANLDPMARRWLAMKNTQVRLTAGNSDTRYFIEAKDEDKTLKIPVEPYFEAEAMKDSKDNLKKLNQRANEIAEYQKKVASGSVIRSISIKGFGTYNWDIVNKRENSLPLFAKFEYPSGTNAELVTLRLISPDENVVVMYNADQDDKFSFDPGKRNLLIGILPNNEIVAASNKAFDPARNKKKGATHTFVMKRTGLKLKKPEDIMKYMDRLI